MDHHHPLDDPSHPAGNHSPLRPHFRAGDALPPSSPETGSNDVPDAFQPEIQPFAEPRRMAPRPLTPPMLTPQPLTPQPLTPGQLWSRSVREIRGGNGNGNGAVAHSPAPSEEWECPAAVEPQAAPRREQATLREVLPIAGAPLTPTEPVLHTDQVSLADAKPEMVDANPLAPSETGLDGLRSVSPLERNAGIWLAGSGADLLETCTRAEQRKHGALGLTVLVPASFALVASAYAVGTLTSNPWIIVPLSLLWSAIILLIDRSLLATYRSSLSTKWKVAQFSIRMTVAVLMGLTIAHPMTLLLFKDTIAAQIEFQRDREIAGVRATATQDKAAVEQKIQAAQARIAEFRAAHQASFQAGFLADAEGAAAAVAPAAAAGLTTADRERWEERMAVETKPLEEELARLDKEKEQLLETQRILTAEIAQWQTAYEAEINGTRSGFSGVGPRARSIDGDQLAWRRVEAGRLSREIERLSTTSFEVQASIQAAKDRTGREYANLAAERETKRRAETARVVALRAQAQETQLASFVAGQDGVRAQIQAQIDSGLADLQLLRDELATVTIAERDRIQEIKDSPRRDLLSQTLAMHHLFAASSEGGRFALLAYLVLAGLFLTVDTIPILVKFTSRSGEYDEKLDQRHYEAALDMLESRKQHLLKLQAETMLKIDATREIQAKEAANEAARLQSRLELIEREIQVAHRKAAFRHEFGFAQRLSRAS